MVKFAVTSVSIQTDQPSVMMVCWIRGPQRDESSKFEVDPDKTEYEFEHTFQRASKLFRDKTGAIQNKSCSLELVMEKEEQTQMVGNIKLDIAELYEKSDGEQTFQLDNL